MRGGRREGQEKGKKKGSSGRGKKGLADENSVPGEKRRREKKKSNCPGKP